MPYLSSTKIRNRNGNGPAATDPSEAGGAGGVLRFSSTAEATALPHRPTPVRTARAAAQEDEEAEFGCRVAPRVQSRRTQPRSRERAADIAASVIIEFIQLLTGIHAQTLFSSRRRGKEQTSNFYFN